LPVRKVDGWEILLLLTTLGAKSGKPHTTPLVYSRVPIVILERMD